MNNGEKRILNAVYMEQKVGVTKHNNRMQEVCVIFCQSGFCNSSLIKLLKLVIFKINNDEIIVSAMRIGRAIVKYSLKHRVLVNLTASVDERAAN
ncbi:hypothetical protein T08_15724 [Trichinella sp. T8]|nr:hypothetical protein T08_15724 [Trichinella sp. T8]